MTPPPLPDRWLKRIWLVNGLVLLPLMLLIVGLVGYAALFEGRSEPAAVEIPDSLAAPAEGPRAVRYDEPVAVLGTETRLVQVRYGTAYVPRESFGVSPTFASRADGYWQQPVVNVLFLDPDGSTRLLLDRPAYLQRVSHPSAPADSAERWISYEIAFDDTDGDRRLTRDDRAGLYVTDLSGRRFRAVLPPGLHVRWHGPFAQGRILIYALEEAADRPLVEARLPQRAFVYDPTRDSLAAFGRLNQAIERAGGIVGR